MGEMAKSLLVSNIVIVVVLVLQFESQYLKSHKKYRSEILHTSRVR